MLDADLAGQLAESLNSINGFPWKPEVVLATAEDLIRWCTGGAVEGESWDAEKQARWLVTEARENWLEWKGTAGLKALFSTKFPPETGQRGYGLGERTLHLWPAQKIQRMLSR